MSTYADLPPSTPLATSPAALVALCTVPNDAVAQALSHQLVEAGVAACVNAFGPIRSVYRWQGKVEDDLELQLIIKTAPSRLDDLKRFIDEHHPYDEPELLILPVLDGAPGYLAWVRQETGG